MPHAQHAIDQVEFKLLDARHLAQLVLDQRLLGRTVHRFDAKAAEPRVVSRTTADAHDGRGNLVGTAGMGFVVVLASRREFDRGSMILMRMAMACMAVPGVVMACVIMWRMFVYRVTHWLSLLVCVLPSTHPVATIGSSLKTGSVT